MNKIYVEIKQWTDKNGEIHEYEEYYIYVDNKYNIPELKVYISIEKEVKTMLDSVGALVYVEKETK